MILFLQKALKSYRSKFLLAVLFIGPISRWWSAIENNRTILDAGRISLGYLIISLLISFFAILFLSFIPDFLNLTRFKFLGIISFTLYILFLAIGLGSFLSSFSLFAENSFILYFLTALFVLLILLSEKFIDFNSYKCRFWDAGGGPTFHALLDAYVKSSDSCLLFFDYKDSHVIPGLIRRFHDAKLEGLPMVTIWGTGRPRRGRRSAAPPSPRASPS